MFDVTRGTGQIFGDIRLMKVVLRVTFQTGFVDARHGFVVCRKKFFEFVRRGICGECGLRPLGRIVGRRAVAIGAFRDGVIGRNFSG